MPILQHFRARPFVTALVVGALVATGSLAIVPAATAATTVATDDFSRTVSSGWGTSTSGRTWATTSPSSTSVDSGSSRVVQATGSSTVQTLAGTIPVDARVSAAVWAEKPTPTGNGSTVSFALRSDRWFSYQARVRFGTSGVNLWISRFDGSTAKEMVLSSSKPIASYSVGQKVRVEFSVSGTSPVLVASRIWIDGSPQPSAWQQTYSDTSAQRRTVGGSFSVQTHLSSGSPANTVRIDDIAITEASATAPQPPAPAPQPPAPAPQPPAPANPPAPLPAPATAAGSLPVGSATYSVPGNAIYVVPRASRTGDGTAGSPYGSAAYAVEKAPNNSTIVLRGGTYHEFVYVGFNRKLTIQAYPGEAVWFDGSSPVSGWTKSGSTWVVNGWNYFFDHRISFSANMDETKRFVDRNPYAGYPDQVWINGAALTQVNSATAVTMGKFFVDEAGKRLVIGSDPSGKKVEASTLARAFKVQGKGTTLRGFGVQRYATTLSMMGTVTAEVDGITLENLVVRDNATVGVFTWNHNQTFNKVTLTGNGMLGLGANGTKNLRITDSVISNNNTQAFKPAPVSGGMKLSRVSGAVVSGNVVANNDSAGIWFDVSSYDLRVTGNRVTGNSTSGVQFEISEKAILANNYISGNTTGLHINNSGNIQVWNNTIDGTTRALSFAKDSRRQEDSSLIATIPWVSRNLTFHNNVISYSSAGSCPLLTQDYDQKAFGNDFGITSNNNVYYRQSSSAPSNFACWANGPAGTRSFKTIEDFASFTGNEKNSALWTGATVTNADLTVKNDVVNAPRAALAALPADVAAAIGVAAGQKRIGPLSPPRQ